MSSAPGSADYQKYWNDPKVQEEYRQLRGAGVVGEVPARAPTGRNEVEREIAEIEKLIPDPRSSYHRGPDSDRLQRRLRELYDMRGGR